MTEPWENEDGSTNVDGWLAAYADDDNNFWRTAQGHIMNVVDELIDRLDTPCPYVRNSDEGTSYCSLGTA